MRTHKDSNLLYFDIINQCKLLINNIKKLFHFLRFFYLIETYNYLFIINMLQHFYKIYVIYTKNFATMHTVYFCTHHKYINTKKSCLIFRQLEDIIHNIKQPSQQALPDCMYNLKVFLLYQYSIFQHIQVFLYLYLLSLIYHHISQYL